MSGIRPRKFKYRYRMSLFRGQFPRPHEKPLLQTNIVAESPQEAANWAAEFAEINPHLGPLRFTFENLGLEN